MSKKAKSHIKKKGKSPEAPINQAESAERLIELISEMLKELHPRKSHVLNVRLDSSLDKDLGFDSLSKVELITRVENVFSIKLPEQILTRSQTPDDILASIIQTSKNSTGSVLATAFKAPLLDVVNGVPAQASTLPEMLRWHTGAHPDRTHIFLYGEGDEPEQITYNDLLKGAEQYSVGLRNKNLQAGQTVAIMLPTGKDYLFSFFGVLLAGGVPVPIYPPANLYQLEDHVKRHVGILQNAQCSILITVPEAKKTAGLIKAQVESIHSIISPQELALADGVFVEHKGKEDEIAFLQYTSGSTGQPKGVTLTHANLLANIRAMGEATEVDSTDIFVSWLPLYHDMGLIGAWFTSLYFAMPLVLMSPLSFLVQPSRWLWTIANHRGSISAAPNFAFELCLKKIPEEKLKNLDLSSLRFLFNGAEPVSPRTIRQFSNKFVKYGFKARALAPVYGLAEVAVGLAFPPPDREPVIDRIQREVLVSKGIAIPVVRQVGEGDDVLEIVACGQPLPGYQIRIVDGAGREVPDRQQGRLEFKGPSATSGYYRNAKATKTLFHGKWLDSGDLAYSSEGDIFLTSRVKDIIIRAGRNLYPHQLEEAIGDIEGVRKGCVAVFGATDSVSETEKLVIVAETRLKDENESTRLRKEIDLLAIDILGMPTDDIVIAPPHTVLKTSSGKIRRSAVRELYERGDMFLHPRNLWWQLARLFAKAFASRFQILNRLCKEYLYAGYVKTIFWVLAPFVWLLVAISPNGNTARFIMRQAARLFLKLCSVPVEVIGLEGLPKQRACVIVANHTSYLDGIIIASILPIEFGFVAKGELKKKFFPRVFLRKIDAVFVERFDKQRGVADARRAAAKVKQGLSLFFFPEGTLTRVPGLLPFYMGAFVAATESNVPVIPVAIKGARSILRSGSWFPHKGKISIVISPAISPVGDDWKSAVNLSKQARIAILSQLNEPDLAAEKIKGVATTL